MQSKSRLALQGLIKFVAGLLLLGAALFLPIPLILQSFWGLIPFALYPVVIVIRILDEERVLTEGLTGYAEYKKKVKYRLIPWIW